MIAHYNKVGFIVIKVTMKVSISDIHRMHSSPLNLLSASKLAVTNSQRDDSYHQL